MNTKSLILKKGLFKKIIDYPLRISKSHYNFLSIQQGKTFNNFLKKKIISNKQIHKG